jgi:hypothetical protein
VYVSCKIAATFLVVTMTWIFFRASSVAQALAIIGKIARLSIHDRVAFNLNAVEVAFSFALIALLLWKEKYYFTIPTSSTIRTAIIFLLIVFGTYLFGVFENNQFIYFQF